MELHLVLHRGPNGVGILWGLGWDWFAHCRLIVADTEGAALVCLAHELRRLGVHGRITELVHHSNRSTTP